MSHVNPNGILMLIAMFAVLIVIGPAFITVVLFAVMRKSNARSVSKPLLFLCSWAISAVLIAIGTYLWLDS